MLQSNQEEEDDDLHDGSDFDDEESSSIANRGTNNNNNNNTSNNNNNNHLHGNGLRGKMEETDGSGALSSLSRLTKHSADILDKDVLKLQKEAVIAFQQQMAVAAMANGLLPTTTPWTPSLPPKSSSPLSINASSLNMSASGVNVLGGGNSIISSSSPGGGSSGSSGPTSSSGTVSSGTHLEAGKGYTFEEQFKQVCHVTRCAIFQVDYVMSVSFLLNLLLCCLVSRVSNFISYSLSVSDAFGLLMCFLA